MYVVNTVGNDPVFRSPRETRNVRKTHAARYKSIKCTIELLKACDGVFAVSMTLTPSQTLVGVDSIPAHVSFSLYGRTQTHIFRTPKPSLLFFFIFYLFSVYRGVTECSMLVEYRYLCGWVCGGRWGLEVWCELIRRRYFATSPVWSAARLIEVDTYR